MKKLIIIFMLLICMQINSYSQSREIYIVFNPIYVDDTGYGYYPREGGIDNRYFSDTGTLLFSITKIVDRKSVYDYFFFNNPTKEPTLKIQYKPVYYLTELQNRGVLIDWDQYYATKTDAEIKAFCESIGKDQIVHFINRADQMGSQITVIQTKRYIPLKF